LEVQPGPKNVNRSRPAPKDLHFPDLDRFYTLETIPLMGLSMIVGFVVWSLQSHLQWGLPFLRVALLMIFACCVLTWGSVVVSMALLDVRNGVRRRNWAYTYRRQVHSRKVRRFLETDPNRYIVHVRYFGGFDVAAEAPVVAIEDTETEEIIAVHPAYTNIRDLCDRLKVSIKTY